MNTESQEGTEINSYQLKKVIPVSSKYTLVEGGSKLCQVRTVRTDYCNFNHIFHRYLLSKS